MTGNTKQQRPVILEGNSALDFGKSYRRPISLTAIGVASAVVILLLGVIPGPGPYDPPKVPPTVLAAIWSWLAANKDSIAPLSQLATALGVGVAAITFFRTQRMNRADWLFKTLKEVRDMMKEVHKKEDYSNEKLIEIIIFMLPCIHISIIDWLATVNGPFSKRICLNFSIISVSSRIG